MKKPDAYTIGWMTGIMYVAIAQIANRVIHNAVVYFIACIAIAIAVYLLGDWIVRRP